MAARGKKNSSYQGMNWCAPATRLALYLRDGMACAWCGAGIEDGAILTLDHLAPYATGTVDNRPTNLVTSCRSCNSRRGDRSVEAFAQAVAEYSDHGVSATDILDHIVACTARQLPRAEARDLIARRGRLSIVLAELR